MRTRIISLSLVTPRDVQQRVFDHYCRYPIHPTTVSHYIKRYGSPIVPIGQSMIDYVNDVRLPPLQPSRLLNDLLADSTNVYMSNLPRIVTRAIMTGLEIRGEVISIEDTMLSSQHDIPMPHVRDVALSLLSSGMYYDNNPYNIIRARIHGHDAVHCDSLIQQLCVEASTYELDR